MPRGNFSVVHQPAGTGYRHILTEEDVRNRLAELPRWMVEPLEVVSGSMTPTLRGPHRDFDCPHCGTHNMLPADFRPMIGRPAYCEHCRRPGPVEAELPIAGTKFSFFTSSAKKPSPASAALAVSPPASERPDA